MTPLLLPDSARLAWWYAAWLRGDVAPDDVADAVVADDAGHHIADLPGHDELTPLLLGLGTLRNLGATTAGLAYPAEGDPVGLGGPAEFNVAALDQGEAVVLPGSGLGLVPVRAGRGVVWLCLPARSRQLIDLGEAGRGYRAAVLEAANRLAGLDVARWRPAVADALLNLRRAAVPVGPPGTPTAAVALAGRGVHGLALVDLALEDDGAAVSAQQADERRAALLPLAAASRRALVAACSPEAWPDEAPSTP
ncbi:hypothetical protein [Nocardioides speluncae]|uniref:hypothetical protein n=1 Tax=Nocardioides speluncae TaxID=2670337 RepID=UPI000D69FFF8|nr:hypothetical protein [Nocardioides speluncae]